MDKHIDQGNGYQNAAKGSSKQGELLDNVGNVFVCQLYNYQPGMLVMLL